MLLFSRVPRGAARSFSALALALTSVSAPSHAQTSFVEDWRWVKFGVAEGLPSPIVHVVVRAANGTMWAATEDGPSWFDGYRWHDVVDAAGHGMRGARSPFITAGSRGDVYFSFGTVMYRVEAPNAPARPLPMYEDSLLASARLVAVGDNIWAMFTRNRELLLARLHEGGWHEERWPGARPASGGFDPSLHAAANGHVLVSVGGAMWERRDTSWVPMPPFVGGTGTMTHFVSTSAGEERLVLRSAEATQGVWARGPSVGGSSWMRFTEFGLEAPAAFDIGPDGSAVAMLDAGDFLYRDREGWRRLLAPRSLATTTSAAFDAGGDVWFSTRAGVVLWRRKSERWQQWRVSSSLPANRVNGLVVGPGGRVVAATAGGVASLEPGGLLRLFPGLPDRAFTSIAFAADRRLWAGSGGSFTGVYQQTPSGWTRRTDAPGLGQAGMHRIVAGRDGSVWLLGLPIGRGAHGGLWRAVGDRIDAVAVPASFQGARFYDMVEDSTGTRWFASDRGVLHEAAGRFTVVDSSRGLPTDRPFSLALGDSGSVWVGMRPSGIVRITAQLAVERPSPGENFPTGQVTLHRASDGRIWATNLDGIWVRVGAQWSLLTGSFGLPTQSLWPITSSGSDIYVGTLGAGVLRLRLDELRDAAPQVELLPPRQDENGLLLQWTVATYRGLVAPEDVMSRWRLDDDAWSAWSSAIAVTAPVRMPWRRHVLHVEARTPLGALAPRTASLEFVVPAPLWWRRGVLVPVGTLLGALVGLSLLLVRRRREQRTLARRVREAERMELVGNFAAGMAHELNNLLTTIVVNAELVEEEMPGAQEPQPAKEIRRAAMQAAGQVRSMLSFTRDQSLVLTPIDLAATLQRQHSAIDALFGPGVATRWEIPRVPVMVRAELNGMSGILRALAENARDAMPNGGRFDVSLTVNALSAAQRRSLGLGESAWYAELAVTDSGTGMTQEASRRAFEPYYSTRDRPGLGLALVYGLTQRFGGAVQLDAAPERGTSIRLYFPVVEAEAAPGAATQAPETGAR